MAKNSRGSIQKVRRRGTPLTVYLSDELSAALSGGLLPAESRQVHAGSDGPGETAGRSGERSAEFARNSGIVTMAKTSAAPADVDPRRSAPPFSFTGHETFVFRHGWLTKAVAAVGADPTIFNSDDAIVRLGVGKNMVRSIRHWGLATGVLQEVPKSRGGAISVSELGAFLLGDSGRDPYLEDPGSLWLLHWQLLTHPTKCTTWQWAFAVMPWNEFSRSALADGLMDAARRAGEREPSESSVRRDVDVFLRTYLPSRTLSWPCSRRIPRLSSGRA